MPNTLTISNRPLTVLRRAKSRRRYFRISRGSSPRMQRLGYPTTQFVEFMATRNLPLRTIYLDGYRIFFRRSARPHQLAEMLRYRSIIGSHGLTKRLERPLQMTAGFGRPG